MTRRESQGHMKRFIQAYPNDKTTRGRRPYRYYNERGEVEEFIRQWDQPGWAVYECRNPLLDTAVGYGAADDVSRMSA